MQAQLWGGKGVAARGHLWGPSGSLLKAEGHTEPHESTGLASRTWRHTHTPLAKGGKVPEHPFIIISLGFVAHLVGKGADCLFPLRELGEACLPLTPSHNKNLPNASPLKRETFGSVGTE